VSGKIDAAYWAERFTQLEQSNHREAERVMQDVESAYREAARELEGQISSWYRRFADNDGIVSMAEARRLLNSRELTEFKWTVGEYARHAKENGVTANWTKQLENASARWHISRLEALKVQMQNTVEVLYGNQLDSLDALAKNTFLFSYNHTAYEIQRGMGIGFDIAGLNQKAIQTAIYKPWTLDGRNFSDRIWANKEALINELHKQLSQNLMMGGNLDRIVETIEKKMGVSKYNAGRLVYTENAYIQAVATGESYRATGVKQFLFVATLDDRTSDICREMDGNVYDMKDYQPGVTVPPLHPWCRSCTAPHYADMAGVGERFARNPDDNTRYFVPRDMTYKQWEQSFVTNPGTGQTGSKAGLTPVSAAGTMIADRSKLKPASNPAVQTILDRYPAIQGEHSFEEDILNTNPKYAESKKNRDKYYTHNCQRCVNAYEARRRGYDVTAAPRILQSDTLPYMMHDKGWANVYENGRASLVSCFARTGEGVKNKVIQQMTAWGNGARAIVRVQWRGSAGGHVFITENHEGDVKFLDPQSGKLDVTDYFEYAKVNQTYLLRTDDKEFSELIEKCCNYK